MRILIAPDKFKSCLTALQVAQAVAAGLPDADLDLCPLADGGEGTVDAMISATSGTHHICRVIGPLPAQYVDAPFGLLGDRQTAVLEMSAASGLHLVPRDQQNPLDTTTFGTGQLLLAAARIPGVLRIILGIGGSATTDAGIGCLQACGCAIDTTTGPVTSVDPPLCGRDVERVFSITPPASPLQNIEIRVACDVTNPLFGPTGAARVFGPQKGATPEIVTRLDTALEQLATRTGMLDQAHRPGAGAAGGLGFGLLAFLGAQLASGFDLVASAVRLADRIAQAELVITGEGRLDAQTLSGKTVAGVARLAARHSKPCIALAGIVEDGAQAALTAAGTPCQCISIRPPTMPIEESIRRAPDLLTQAAQALPHRAP